MADTTAQKQVNIRVGAALYRALESVAQKERRSVSQAARLLLEEGLRERVGGRVSWDDTPGADIAALATAGGAFTWLADEPDDYDDTCGEPV